MMKKKDTPLKASTNTPSAEAIDSIYSFLTETGFSESVDAAIILGSGLGGFEQRLTHTLSITYKDIPGFPQTTVAGHNGTLSIGTIGSKTVLVFSGRFHHYEGHPFERTLLPVHLSHAFSSDILLVSNAAGGINNRFQVGDLMLIDSLIVPGVLIKTSETSLWSSYQNETSVRKATSIAAQMGLHLVRGTYFYAKGPSYETKAEIKAFRTMGADAVGMSTAPELIEAQHLGMRSLGISLITNMAAGVSKQKLAHEEIKEAASKRALDFARLMETFIQQL